MMSDLIWLSIRLTFITLCYARIQIPIPRLSKLASPLFTYWIFFVNVVKRKILVKL